MIDTLRHSSLSYDALGRLARTLAANQPDEAEAIHTEIASIQDPNAFVAALMDRLRAAEARHKHLSLYSYLMDILVHGRNPQIGPAHESLVWLRQQLHELTYDTP